MALAAPSRQRMALKAASQLPTTFADDCALHSGAAESQPNDLEHQAWVNGCAQFEKLGRWKIVDQTSSSLGGLNGFVLVQGRAVFDGGEYRLQSFWKVGNDRAEIFFLGLKNATDVIDVPNYPPIPDDQIPRNVPKHMIDPPMGRDVRS